MITMGSLFDGSGGFPLAGTLAGMKPVWASEIEPYPLRVTAARFPEMKQLGDVTKINGAEIEPVDVITFGSPCQDLSTAGKQAGIHNGKRSCLFFEAIRIIREMRSATYGRYPAYAVWEKVPGAFSSNRGEDFGAVLEAFVETIERKHIDVPRPEDGWRGAGCVRTDNGSVAWRVLDAQYWGVPQRRRRIYLVADLRGQRAGKILFEREGLRGDIAESGASWQRDTGDAENCATLFFDITGESSNSMRSPTKDSCFRERNISRTLDTWVGTPECNQGGIVAVDCRNAAINEKVSGTLQAHGSGGTSLNAINPVICLGNGQAHNCTLSDVANTLDCMHDQQIIATASEYLVRRLTPLECCRLQGFPDWWEAGVEGSDTARYKMWGNGIALPCARYVMEGIADQFAGWGE